MESLAGSGLTVADGVIAVIVLISAILAYARGLVREALAIGGWILAGYLAVLGAPLVEPLLREIPTVGGYLQSVCSLSKLVSFATVFAGCLVLLSIFTPLFSSAVQDSMLGPVDRALGFLFGVLRGVVLVAVVWLVYSQIIPPVDRPDVIETARSIAFIRDTAEMIQTSLPTALPDWLAAPVNTLMADCGGVPALTPDPAPVTGG